MINAKNVHEILDKHILADGMSPVMDIEKSHGSYIVDARDGSEYLDMFSMYASGSIGYNHPYLIKHKDFLGAMAVNKPAMSDMYNVEYAEFMKVFERVAMPDYLPHLFFISGGALGIENALKASFDWKTRKNMANGSDTLGSKVIHFKQAFHGRTGYTLSLTNTADPRKYMYFPLFDWPRITNPKRHFPSTEESETATRQMEEQAISEIKKAISEDADSMAALIIEPIQSEGGDNHFNASFLQSLRSICDEHDIMFIIDEVQTGIGMTGKMWAHQHYGIEPDFIVFGKKTQVCGMMAGRRIDEIEKNVFQESSRINSTFGGNFIDMMRLKLILEVIENENLVDHAANMGSYLLQKIEELSAKYPDTVSNARGIGLLCAFDLPDGEFRSAFANAALEQKMIILGCGTKSIRFRPHLNVSKEDIDKAISICDSVLQKLLVTA